MVTQLPKPPQRGEIWYVKLPSDPPDKGGRPVVVISIDARNNHPRATTVLVLPLSTTPARLPTHIALSPGETGLSENSTIQAENITTVLKTSLQEPRQKLRRLSERTIERTARCVVMAMGFPDLLLHLEHSRET
jgi:mRNA-degrading endonuclease toxin of MazEF toxin-antitoxin module